MNLDLKMATLEAVALLDFKSPFDELTELRAVLTTKEIAEFTGLRRETISRARPDRPFRRRTERVLGDLYAVVTRMRTALDGNTGQLAAILRRPQPELDGRSIADLLRAGEVDLVLKHLDDPRPPRQAVPEPSLAAPAVREKEPRVAAVKKFLAADPELAERLPEIEAKLRQYFAPVERIERSVLEDFEALPGEPFEEFHLRVVNDLSVKANVECMGALFEAEMALIDPVHDRLLIGFL